MNKPETQSVGSLEPVGSVDWRQCPHDFQLHFGTIKRCRKCGATVAVSMDGKPKDIWPPLSEWMDGLIPPNDKLRRGGEHH